MSFLYSTKGLRGIEGLRVEGKLVITMVNRNSCGLWYEDVLDGGSSHNHRL